MIVTIDGRELQVQPGATVLDACRQAGIEVPTLCHLPDHEHFTSCMICLVRDAASGRLLPSCSTPAQNGQAIETQHPEVTAARRGALELLLSEHAGDCDAPCTLGCPCRMDIPAMIRAIAAGRDDEALRIVKRDIALPAVLGRICPAPCEKVCRRGKHDGALGICLLKRHAADRDLASGAAWRPDCLPATGRRVAIVGGGPTGLAAAWHLLQRGHACVIFERDATPGGELRRGVSAEKLPRGVLDAEIATIVALGATLKTGVRVGEDITYETLYGEFDATIIATGALPAGAASGDPALARGKTGITVAAGTGVTSRSGVFAGGGVVRPLRLAVRACADGKQLAGAVDAFLCGHPVIPARTPFNSSLGTLLEGELTAFMDGAPSSGGHADAGADGYTPDVARDEARRCLHCDCRKPEACRLRDYAQTYNASQRRYAGERARHRGIRQPGGVVFEPGKCIKCGICVRITEKADETPGLAFIGRGFTVEVQTPFGATLGEALRKTAAQCVNACPTGALAWDDMPQS